MKQLFPLLVGSAVAVLTCLPPAAQAQDFREDNKAYRTLYADDLCAMLARGRRPILIDVRSAGEFADTSANRTLNLGHLRGALNFDVATLEDHLAELAPYRDTTLVLYCSHSQRSRVAAKFLTEKGFHVYTLNGGMSDLRVLPATRFPCRQELLQTNLPFGFVSPVDLRAVLAEPNVRLLDVRDDATYAGTGPEERFTTYGHFREGLHIPLARLEAQAPTLDRGLSYVVIDNNGEQAIAACTRLAALGFPHLRMLVNGMDAYYAEQPRAVGLADRLERTLPYEVLDVETATSRLRAGKIGLVLDIRPAAEFRDQAKEPWRNRGHIRGAINIPLDSLSRRLAGLKKYRNKPVLVYGFGGMETESTKACRLLSDHGFRQVASLRGGIYAIVWRTANRKGFSGTDLIVSAAPAP